MTKFAIKGWNPSKPQTVITIKKVSQKSGQKYETGYFFNCLLEFALMTNGMSINAFIKTKKTSPNLHFYVTTTKAALLTTRSRARLMLK